MNNNDFKLNLAGLATAIGSMPHTDPAKACEVVREYLPDIPVWPQLPNRSFLENMYVQYSEGLPGIVLSEERIHIDRTVDLSDQMEALYAAYIENDLDRYAVSREYALGLHEFLNMKLDSARAVKGQVTGPVSFGLTVTDQDRRPTLYDETLADAIAFHLRLKAAWMERELAKLSPNTIVFLDEPYLASLGSAFVAIDNEIVIRLTNEALGGIRGLKGMHCCGNTDWSVLMATEIDILNFDAYTHGEALVLYPSAVREFLDRGGILAWGIVPSDETEVAGVTASGLIDRLSELMDYLTGKGVDREALAKQCLITPSCGAGSLSEGAAESVLKLTEEVSSQFRNSKRLGGG
ncbi:MAG: methionine synthase [Dehalococcoidia bacterium]